MKETITKRYNAFKSPLNGAIPTLSKAIRGMKYGKLKISDAFNKFVSKSEYAQDEKDMILEDLYLKTQEENHAEIPLINKGLKN